MQIGSAARQALRVAGEELSFSIASWQHKITSGRGQPRHKVLVNGSPKSGTTWMLRMLSSLPGYRAVGNFQGDIGRYASVQPGDVVHGHDPYSAELGDLLQANQIKVVLLMRDPRDQVVSHLFHIRRVTDNPWHERLTVLDDDEALLACIEGPPGLRDAASMVRLTQSWLDDEGRAFCVRYEDLSQDPVRHLAWTLDYLGINASDRFIRLIVARNRFERLTMGRRIWKTARKPGDEAPSSHFRKGVIGDWRNHFKDAHVETFKRVAGQTLIEWGYEDDFDW